MVLPWLYVESRSREKAGPTAYAFETNVMGIGFVLQPPGPWNVILLYFSKFSLDDPFPWGLWNSISIIFRPPGIPPIRTLGLLKPILGRVSGLVLCLSWLQNLEVCCPTQLAHFVMGDWYSQDPPYRSLPQLWKTVSLMTTRSLSIPTSSVVQTPPSASQCCLSDSLVHQAQEKRSVQQKPLNSLLE